MTAITETKPKRTMRQMYSDALEQISDLENELRDAQETIDEYEREENTLERFKDKVEAIKTAKERLALGVISEADTIQKLTEQLLEMV